MKNDMPRGKRYKCPYCEYRGYRPELIEHVEDDHDDMIPNDHTPARVVYNAVNKKNNGSCMICHRETKWDESKQRYDTLCDNPKCKKEYLEIVRSRMVKKYGTYNLLKDPNFQKKMLDNRSISGKYKFVDGGCVGYVGSYEKKFLEFMDQFLHIKSYDIISPGPNIPYMYKGKEHVWITDFIYEPYNLVFDIKDGGDNPNTRDMKEYREKQTAKEKAIAEYGEYNYIRLTNNNFEQLISIFMELKDNVEDKKPIVRINESYNIREFDNNEIVKFDPMSNAIKYGVDDILLKNDPEKYAYNYRSKDSFMGTTSYGKDIIDSKLQSRIESFDRERAKYILESNDIINEYNLWIEFEINRILRNAFIGHTEKVDGIAEELATIQARILMSESVDEETIRNFIKGTYFYSSQDPDTIRDLLNMRLKYNQKITDIMHKMIKVNYGILGYTEIEMKELSYRLNNGTNDSNSVLNEIKERIYKNKEFITNYGECINLNSLGFGKIFITNGKDYTGVHRNEKNATNATQAIDGLLQKAMEYDCVVMCHGTESYTGGFLDGGNCAELYELYKKAGKSYQEFMDNYADISWRWTIQKIRTDKSDYYESVNCFVARLIKEGYKNILIVSCNPGAHKLDPIFDKQKGIKITYTKYKNLIESFDEEDLNTLILESENELKKLAESCDIVYEDLDYDNEYTELENINEATISIVEFAKRILKFIVSLFKRIWEIFKKVFNILKQKFRPNSITKIDTPIKLYLIALESASLQDYTVKNENELSKIVNKNFTQMQKEIQKRQQIQIHTTKQLAEFAKTL